MSTALAVLAPAERPHVVHVVDEIPITTWFRPSVRELSRAGLPVAGPRAWYLDARGGAYRRLTAAARKRLIAGR